MNNPLNIQVIRSSSAGNCTAVWHDGAGLLIDAGIPRHLLIDFMARTGNPINALIITHAHRDHLTNAACRYLLQQNVPVYFANDAVLSSYQRSLPCLTTGSDLIRTYEGMPFQVKDFMITPFPVQHDSQGGCYGFNVVCGSKKISFATDLVDVPDGLVDRFADSDAIIIESNHDPDMLMQSSRPWHTKVRIRDRAHLSNAKCAGFLERVLSKTKISPQYIVLAHISQECNERALAEETIKKALHHSDTGPFHVMPSYHDRPADKISV